MLTCFFMPVFRRSRAAGSCGEVLYEARSVGSRAVLYEGGRRSRAWRCCIRRGRRSRAWHRWRGYKKEADAFATATFFEEREKYEKFVYLTSIIIARFQMIVNIIYKEK